MINKPHKNNMVGAPLLVILIVILLVLLLLLVAWVVGQKTFGQKMVYPFRSFDNMVQTHT